MATTLPCDHLIIILDLAGLLLRRVCLIEVSSGQDLEERLPVKLAVFEGIEGGVLGVLVREAFDGDHAADLLLF